MAILTKIHPSTKAKAQVTDAQSVFVGLDVHKETIVLAARQGYSKEWLAEKTFSTKDLSKLQKFLHQLSKHGAVRCCYEASGAGFQLHREIVGWGFGCDVIAPSLIPTKSSDRRKCDRLDAQKLADYYRSGLLTVVTVPSSALEAARGVVRCRQAIREKVTQSKHQVSKFLQTKGIVYRDGTAWTTKHRTWLGRLKFSEELDAFTFEQYLSMLQYLERRLGELDEKIEQMASSEPFKKAVLCLRAFRGVQTLTAMVLLTELGDVRRFASPRHLMSYVGLVPSVHQSGEMRKSGGITKTGSARCRHVLVQAAWCNTRAPKKPSIEIQEGRPAWVVESSRTAHKRLYSRFRHLENTVGRHKAVVAIARELIGFLGATLYELATEPQGTVQLAQ